MKLLQVAARASYRGLFPLPLMKRLRQMGFHAEALAGPDDAVDMIEAEYLEFLCCTAGHKFNHLVLRKARCGLAALFAERQFDIVYTRFSLGGIIDSPLAYHRAKTVINTLHGFDFRGRLHPFARRICLADEGIALRWAHELIFVSEAEGKLALTLGIWGEEKSLA